MPEFLSYNKLPGVLPNQQTQQKGRKKCSSSRRVTRRQCSIYIRASCVSYSFVIVSWLKGIGEVGRIVLGILFDLSQDSRSCGSWLGFLCTVFPFSYLPLFSL